MADSTLTVCWNIKYESTNVQTQAKSRQSKVQAKIAHSMFKAKISIRGQNATAAFLLSTRGLIFDKRTDSVSSREQGGTNLGTSSNQITYS